jgi:hypothetical protein
MLWSPKWFWERNGNDFGKGTASSRAVTGQ